MRYLIVSDIHGSVSGMKRLSSIVKEEKPDCLLLLGDILHGGYDEDDYYVANALKSLSCGILAVRGNCDYSSDEGLLAFPLPLARNIPLNNGLHSLYMMHRPPVVSFPIGDVVLFGHTHRKTLYRDHGVVYFNPGSISLPRDDGPGYGILEEGKLILKDVLTLQVITQMDI